MNLKEAFRFQKRLNTIMYQAFEYIKTSKYAFTVTNKHLVNKANPDVQDFEEVVVQDGFLGKTDDIAKVAVRLLEEREKLSLAISEAKNAAEFNIDILTDLNSNRRLLNESLSYILSCKPKTATTYGYDHKFNAEGNQTQYRYNIEVIQEDNFDRDWCKTTLSELLESADKTSNDIEKVLITTEVEYVPPFKINDKFEDIISSLL